MRWEPWAVLYFCKALLDQLDAFDDFQHADIIAVPAVADEPRPAAPP